jgi:hypothetical protein
MKLRLGSANSTRKISARVPPTISSSSAVTPYWMPITLWL